jgi:aspartate aminotransferase-like enzyme
MTPGPTKIPLSVQEASRRAVVHHRSLEFSTILAELLENIKPLFGTLNNVLPVHTTGRGAMEASIANLFSAGDHLLCISNGKFGAMFADIAENYQCRATRITTSWEEEIDLAQIEAYIRSNPDLKAITVVHSDTSSGISNPIKEIAQLTKHTDILLIVDGISSIGSVIFEFDEWGVDVAITASQKGLMSFPGLSFVVLSEKAWKLEEHSTLPKYYTNFKSILESVTKEKRETPGTTPVSLVAAVHEAVNLIHKEGLTNVVNRFEKSSKRLRDEMEALGFSQYPHDINSYSSTVSLFQVPEGYHPNDIQKNLLDNANIYIAKGLGYQKDTIIRIAHMGDIQDEDIDSTLLAITKVLEEGS